MRWPLLLGFLLLHGPGPQAARACLLDFATVADDAPDAAALVESAYSRLLDEVGGLKLTPEVLRATLAGGDPFRIYEETQDLGTLQRRLSDLKAMLAERKWDTPQLRTHLLEGLVRRTTSADAAVKALKVAVRLGEGSYEIPFHTTRPIQISPDGRWVITHVHESLPPTLGGRHSVLIFDTQARTLHKTPRPEGFGADPIFVPGRPEVIFPMSGGGLVAVPNRGGVLDFDHAKELLAKEAGSVEYRRALYPTTTPGVFYGDRREGFVPRIDLNRGVHEKIPLPKDVIGNFDWGAVPQQNRFFFLQSEGAAARLIMTTYDAEGKFTVENRERKFHSSAVGKIRFSSDGKTLIATGEAVDDEVLVGPTEFGTPLRPVTTANGTTTFDGRINGVLPLDGKNQIIVISAAKAKGGTNFDLIDLETKRSVKSFRIPQLMNGPPQLSRDGHTLIFSHPESGGNPTVLNLAQRFGFE